jgi:GntR family transcriptional regulator, rspAB operon transcriptional repressor
MSTDKSSAFCMTSATPMIETQMETNAERIMVALRDAIVRLELKPGDPVSESEMGLKFGVSRQPVREALIRLAEFGLVSIRPRRATRVVKISETSVLNARFVREALEVEVMRKAAMSAKPEWAATLHPLLDEQEAAVAALDIDRFHALDERFHHTIAELAGVGFVWDLIDVQKMQLDRVRYMTLSSNLALSLREHRDIAEAILAGNAPLAEATLRRHLGKITDHLIRGRKTHPDFFESSRSD